MSHRHMPTMDVADNLSADNPGWEWEMVTTNSDGKENKLSWTCEQCGSVHVEDDDLLTYDILHCDACGQEYVCM